MARIKYYYDTENCQFEKATLTWKSAFRSIFMHLGVSAIVAAGMVALLFVVWDDPVVLKLKKENEELTTKLSSYDDRVDQIEVALATLHEKDNELYRSILNAEPIPMNVWDGHHGGAAEVPKFNNESVQNLEERLQKLKWQVMVQQKSNVEVSKIRVEKDEELKHMPSIRPVGGGLISGFGMRHHPILGIKKLHTGIDFRAPMGTPVYATGDGIVKFAGVMHNGYGTHVDLDHGYGYITKYAHLSKLVVKKGQKVKRGDLLGYSGNTGLSKGPHLHYEIIKNGKKINPIDYFYSDLTPEQYSKLKEQAAQDNESMD